MKTKKWEGEIKAIQDGLSGQKIVYEWIRHKIIHQYGYLTFRMLQEEAFKRMFANLPSSGEDLNVQNNG